MSNIYLLGDTHYGHGDISKKFRTHFSCDDEHNSTIHQNVMSCSGKRNHLWLLGDICMKPEHFYKLTEYKHSFETVTIALGNHDHPQIVPYCVKNGIRVVGIVKKWGFWVSHAPIHTQELYRGLCIHGHTHANNVDHDKYFSVSCENVGYEPIKLAEIREIFASRGVLNGN